MRVMVVASLAYSLTNFRRQLLTDLVGQGHAVIACAPDRNEQVIAALNAMGIEFRTVRMEPTGTNPLRDLGTFLSLVRLFRHERPDVVLAYTQKPIIYSGLACRFAGKNVRFCAMVTGLGHAFSDRPGLKHALVRRVVTNLYRLALPKAACVFAFNERDAADINGMLLRDPARPAHLLPGSGVDLDRFPAEPVPQGPPTFLLVARMLRDKGVEEFVEAAARVRALFPKARFQLLGPLAAAPHGVARERIDRWVGEGAVEYLGETSDVRPFLRAATVLVLPSYYREGIPRSILEAMATARPIITTDLPGCRDTVEEGVNGFVVPPRDAGALAGAMTRFCVDAACAREMGRRSRELAEQRFDAKAVSRTILANILPAGGTEPVRRKRALGDMRVIEALAGGALAVLTLPLTLLVALFVWGSLGRPLLFVQRRAGLGGKPFRLVKFRTMDQARGPDGALLPDAARLRPVGRLLRRMRVDELPELWHIVRGDMALVGPRPLLPETVASMGADGERRGQVKPGLTGWAQVNGNALLSNADKLALDLWYVEHRSLGLDLAILWRTLVTVIGGEHVNRPALRRAYARAADRRG